MGEGSPRAAQGAVALPGRRRSCLAPGKFVSAPGANVNPDPRSGKFATSRPMRRSTHRRAARRRRPQCPTVRPAAHAAAWTAARTEKASAPRPAPARSVGERTGDLRAKTADCEWRIAKGSLLIADCKNQMRGARSVRIPDRGNIQRSRGQTALRTRKSPRTLAESTHWAFPASLQPKPEGLRFDLASAMRWSSCFAPRCRTTRSLRRFSAPSDSATASSSAMTVSC